MTSSKSLWLRTGMVAVVIGVAFGAVRYGRMGGRASGGDPQVGCGGPPVDESAIGTTRQAVGESGMNNLHPAAIDSEALKVSVLNSFNISSQANPDPLQLCEGQPGASSCNLKVEWKNWVDGDSTLRKSLMRAMTKCALPSGYSVTHPDGTSFPGQWGLYQGWKTNRLNGQDKRERMSSCILSLLNGLNYDLVLCIIGPGGAPFSTACTDPMITIREGGFYGDLFAASPTAYVVGPQTDAVGSGRICGSTSNNYCCPEDPAEAAALGCTHKIIKTGGFSGPNGRCTATAMAGSFEYCTSFFSTREPGRAYNYVFTSFVPPAL